jgi:KDO2-lipid IV(A) lauroyltransferase
VTGPAGTACERRPILTRLGDWLVRSLAALWYRLDRRHRRITLANLTLAYGPALNPAARELLARRVFQHFVRFAWEVCELLLAPPAVIRRKVVILGEEHVLAALALGRGMVAIAAHAGNWEYTVMGYGLQYRPVAVVGREMDHPVAARLARYLRQRGGNFMVDKQKGLRGILGHLRANRAVGIIIDQNTTTEGGMLVDFFGHPARTTPVAALLDIRHHLEAQSRVIEAWVRSCPEQWLWLHRRWKNQFPEIYEASYQPSAISYQPKP